MKIGIFGTGMVGRTLAERFIADGHQVMIGTRNIEKTLANTEPDLIGTPPYYQWQENNVTVQLGTFADTANFGEMIFISTFGQVALHAIDLAGIEKFDRKIVIDTTNPLDLSGGIPPSFAGAIGNSLGEQIQRHLPQAQVVKAFNTLSMHIVVNPQLEEGVPVLLLAGNDKEAKVKVEEVAKGWGWKDVIDLGDIGEAFYMEASALLWIRYAFNNASWTHAFSLLRK
ncbi:NADPH-dependent F420 reductase [Pedobacter agri]|uniref:NADPH-dependent F420 reductase n=1 Tax=Pedobacter agri TaxID=454586 RepID=UPI0029304D70|nr:NAD(P)-binding domain-containing protein [Pedobacter agri]